MTNAEKYAYSEADKLPPKLRSQFDDMVRKGNTPQFAMMCLLRSAPKMQGSDQALNRQARYRMNTMNEKHRESIVGFARKAGINTNGKYYEGQLGGYADPAAWVSTADDILDVCRKRNYGCDGVVQHKRVEMPVGPKPKLAKDIVRREAQRMLKKDPSLRERVAKGKVKPQAIREMVVAKHGKGG